MILIPGLLIAGWLAYLSAKSERAQIEQGAIQRAHEIAAAIDREIIGMQNLLAVLASSHALYIDDLRGQGRVEHDGSSQPLRILGAPYDRTYRQVAQMERDDLRRRFVRAGAGAAAPGARAARSDRPEPHGRPAGAQRHRAARQRPGATHRLLRGRWRRSARRCITSPGNCGRPRSTSSEWRARSPLTSRSGAAHGSRPISTAASRVDQLSEEIRTTIYRVVQEGLTNVAKHAPEARPSASSSRASDAAAADRGRRMRL